MTEKFWTWNALETAAAIRAKKVSAREVTQSVLQRIHDTNPRTNALPHVLADEALLAAAAADATVARGEALEPLHGVPVTTKVNVDQKGCASTGGLVKLKDLIAQDDAPVVAHLRQAGAIIVGRSNTPAFSLRWFCDNDVHGRTLNPWNAAVTPGGSSGGAAAALASGMGSIAHGNDYGGSIRYPAFACGVVGLRPTQGRVPAYNGTSQVERGISSQMMSVQGPLTRTVADARLALQVMAQGSVLDPLWIPAPLDYPDSAKPCKVALFKGGPGIQAHRTVVAALDRAALALQAAGYQVEEAAPPHYLEACDLWRQLVWDDLRRAVPLIDQLGDQAVRTNMHHFLAFTPALERDAYLALLGRRLGLSRTWSLFHAQYPVLLMPNSWETQFSVDDDTKTLGRLQEITAAQGPLLCTAMLGLPGISVPTGIVNGLPTGVQLSAWRFREDLILAAAEVVERAAKAQTLVHDKHLPL